jgi:hypothetical protein
MHQRRRHLRHGQWRRWYLPWTVICRCGLNAWPCPAAVMLEQQAAMQAARRPAQSERRSWTAARTMQLPVLSVARDERPLLTPGQAHRSRRRQP